MFYRRALVSLIVLQLLILPAIPMHDGVKESGRSATNSGTDSFARSVASNLTSSASHLGNVGPDLIRHGGALSRAKPVGTPIVSPSGRAMFPQTSGQNHWWLFDYWDNTTAGGGRPPYMDGHLVAVANTMGSLNPGDAILYLPLNVAYGTDAYNCVWFQFDIQLTGSGQVSWYIWDIKCPGTNVNGWPLGDYHSTAIGFPYVVGNSYDFSLTTSGSNTVTFSINNTTTGASWSKNNWVWTVPSTTLLALDTTFSPSSTLEGYTTSSNVTNVPLLQTTVGKGVVANRFYSQSYLSPILPGVTTGRFFIDASHWVWEMSPAGTIVVNKTTSGSDGTFQFTTTGGGWLPSSFNIYTTGRIGNSTFYNLLPGSYGISESVPSGWNLASSSCTAGTPSNFPISTGTVTCNFKNRAVGTLVLKKVITGGGDGLFNFTSLATGTGTNVLPSSFQIRTIGGIGNVTFTNVDASLTYAVSEKSSISWTLIGSSCTTGSISTFTVSVAATTTCVFNDENSSLPDVGITSVTVSRNFAYNGVASHPITLNVTVANLCGGQSETFTVSAFYNSTQVGGAGGGRTVTLAAGSSTVLIFNWYANSTGTGKYTVSGHVSSVPGETNLANNDLALSRSFQVRKGGDVDGDGSVDISDVLLVWQNQFTGTPFGAYDLDNDGAVDLTDLIVTWAHEFI